MDFTLPARSITTLYFNTSETSVQWAPNSPNNVSATNITETSAKISWTMPADWSVKTLPADYTVKTNGYYVFRKEANGSYTKLTTSGVTTNLYYNVSGLKPGYKYTFAICSRDELYNISAFSEVTFRTTCSSNCPDTTALPVNKIGFAVYPNPAFDQIRIELPVLSEDTKIEICSSAGVLVRSVIIADSSEDIDIADLPAGLYIVRLICKEGIGTQTIMKQ